MRLALYNLAWVGSDSAPYVNLLETLGVEGLEVAPSVLFGEDYTRCSDAEIARTVTSLADRGVQVVGVGSLFFGHPEFQFADGPAAGEQLVTHAKRLVELCCGLGGQYLFIGSPANRRLAGFPVAEARRRAAETLHHIGEYAAERGVCFTVEVLDARYGCELGCSLEEVAELLAMANTTGVRPHLDTGTTDPADAIPFVPGQFGSFQVSARAGTGLRDDPAQQQWATFLHSGAELPEWLSLELPPPGTMTFEENRARITAGLRDVAEVFG